MRINRGLIVVALIGAVVGAGGVIASISFNHRTSTDKFCSTSCHSMTFQVSDPYFEKSGHRANSKGVTPSCGDCHIPTTNWFIETYTHVSSGIRDVIAELTHNYADPKIWEERRIELEPEVIAKIRRQNSVTCRGCHVPAAIKPKSETGRSSHEMMRQGGVSCIDCHINLVHPPQFFGDHT